MDSSPITTGGPNLFPMIKLQFRSWFEFSVKTMFLNDDKDSRSVFCETSDNASVSRLEKIVLVLLRFFTESSMANDDSVLRSIRAKSPLVFFRRLFMCD